MRVTVIVTQTLPFGRKSPFILIEGMAVSLLGLSHPASWRLGFAGALRVRQVVLRMRRIARLARCWSSCVCRCRGQPCVGCAPCTRIVACAALSSFCCWPVCKALVVLHLSALPMGAGMRFRARLCNRADDAGRVHGATGALAVCRCPLSLRARGVLRVLPRVQRVHGVRVIYFGRVHHGGRR